MSYPARVAPSPRTNRRAGSRPRLRRPTPSRIYVDTSKEVGDVDQLKESKYVANVFRLFFKCRAQELWPGRTISQSAPEGRYRTDVPICQIMRPSSGDGRVRPADAPWGCSSLPTDRCAVAR